MGDTDPQVMQITKEEMAEAINTSLKSILPDIVASEMKSSVDKKHLMFDAAKVGLTEKELATKTRNEKAALFIKLAFKNDMDGFQEHFAEHTKAMNEGTGSAGGFLVPEEFRAGVMRIAETAGLARAHALRMPMKRDKLNFNTETSSVAVTFPGENTAGTATQPVLARTTLDSETAVGLTAFSNELLADADIDTFNYVSMLFGEALAVREDLEMFVGTGSPFNGILINAAVTTLVMAGGNVAFTDLDADDLSDMISNVKSSVLPTSAYYMHRQIWNIVRKLKDSTGAYIAQIGTNQPVIIGRDVASAPVSVGTIWGFQVFLTDQLPDLADSAISTEFLVFGSLSKGFAFGDRQQMTLQMSQDATIGADKLFEQNMSALRVTERIALSVALGAAMVTLKTAAA